jgi:hypothetical protein
MARRPSRADIDDRKVSIRLFLIVALVVALAGAFLFFVVGPAIAAFFAPGLGLKSAALIAFGATLAVMIVMAVAAGDGLLGELQYMIAGFAGFFVVLWLLIAWAF